MRPAWRAKVPGKLEPSARLLTASMDRWRFSATSSTKCCFQMAKSRSAKARSSAVIGNSHAPAFELDIHQFDEVYIFIDYFLQSLPSFPGDSDTQLI